MPAPAPTPATSGVDTVCRVWLCGCAAVWLCSCVAVWLCGCGCVAVWLWPRLWLCVVVCVCGDWIAVADVAVAVAVLVCACGYVFVAIAVADVAVAVAVRGCAYQDVLSSANINPDSEYSIPQVRPCPPAMVSSGVVLYLTARCRVAMCAAMGVIRHLSRLRLPQTYSACFRSRPRTCSWLLDVSCTQLRSAALSMMLRTSHSTSNAVLGS